MTREQLAHVFERFYQGKNEHNKHGLGLGLSIVKSLVEMHGGEIYADDSIISLSDAAQNGDDTTLAERFHRIRITVQLYSAVLVPRSNSIFDRYAA